jgi:hypothetical protein
MIYLAACDGDLQLIAETYIHERETGSQDGLAFDAAVLAYRGRHPGTSNGEAALIVSNLMQELPRANNI